MSIPSVNPAINPTTTKMPRATKATVLNRELSSAEAHRSRRRPVSSPKVSRIPSRTERCSLHGSCADWRLAGPSVFAPALGSRFFRPFPASFSLASVPGSRLSTSNRLARSRPNLLRALVSSLMVTKQPTDWRYRCNSSIRSRSSPRITSSENDVSTLRKSSISMPARRRSSFAFA